MDANPPAANPLREVHMALMATEVKEPREVE